MEEKVEEHLSAEERAKNEALFDEKRQANIVKEALEKEDLDAIAWDKVKNFICSPWFPIFCILIIAFVYFFVNI